MLNTTHCPPSNHSPLLNRQQFVMSVWHRLLETGRKGFRNLTRKPELRVWHHRDRQGGIHWHAYNPTTGKSFSASSEAEMRIWVEKQYLY